MWVPKAKHCHIPPVTPFFFLSSFLLYFSCFLSSSLSVLLFVLLQSKNLILTDHSHWSLTLVTYTPVTHMPTQAERSLAAIFDHTPKSSTKCSFSSSLLSYSFFDLAEASKLSSMTTSDLRWKRFDLEARSSIWKLCCRHWEQLYWKLVFDLEAFFFFFNFFIIISWCIINKCEWSFEFGVMSCFRWC